MSRLLGPVNVWAAAFTLVFGTIVAPGCMLVRGFTDAVTDAVSPATLADLRAAETRAKDRAALQSDELDTVKRDAAKAREKFVELIVKVNTHEASRKTTDERIKGLVQKIEAEVAATRPLLSSHRNLKERLSKNIARNELRETGLDARMRTLEQFVPQLGVVRTVSANALEKASATSAALSAGQGQVDNRLDGIERDLGELRLKHDSTIRDVAERKEEMKGFASRLDAQAEKVIGLEGWFKGSTLVGTVIGGVLAILVTFATVLVARHRRVLDKAQEQSLTAFRLASETRAEAKAISGLVSSEPALLGLAAERYQSAVKQDRESVRDAFDEFVETLSEAEQRKLLRRCKDTAPADIVQFLVDVAQKRPGVASSPSAKP